jgi:GNAT superfamily N-acetyltransferase
VLCPFIIIQNEIWARHAVPLAHLLPLAFHRAYVLKKTMSQAHNFIHLPPGYKIVPVRTIYLEMRSNPVPKRPAPPYGCAIRRWRRPPLKGYRRLFSAVGGKWGWSGRLIMGDAELQETIQAETTAIFLLKWNAETAGFVELDRRVPGQTEIAYLGLLPEFIGRGMGKYLLDWAMHRAWRSSPERIWLHTCAYDHSDALAVYLKAGFKIVEEKVEMQPYPEDFLQRPKPAGS